MLKYFYSVGTHWFFLFKPWVPFDVQVHPSDVLGPSVPGPIILLVDCPTSSHFQELSCLQCLSPYYIDTAYDALEGSKIVNCVIHLTPACITQTDDYQMWMSKFGAAQHIMAGHEMLVSLKIFCFQTFCFDCFFVLEELELMDLIFPGKIFRCQF